MATTSTPTLNSTNDALRALKEFCEKVTQTLENLPKTSVGGGETEVEFNIDEALGVLNTVSSRLK